MLSHDTFRGAKNIAPCIQSFVLYLFYCYLFPVLSKPSVLIKTIPLTPKQILKQPFRLGTKYLFQI